MLQNPGIYYLYRMKKMLLFVGIALLILGCQQPASPPYSATHYDSLMVQTVAERDSVLWKMVHVDKVPDSVAIQKGKDYKEKFAKIFEEKRKYYN
jgi:hypothetical protein